MSKPWFDGCSLLIADRSLNLELQRCWESSAAGTIQVASFRGSLSPKHRECPASWFRWRRWLRSSSRRAGSCSQVPCLRRRRLCPSESACRSVSVESRTSCRHTRRGNGVENDTTEEWGSPRKPVQ